MKNETKELTETKTQEIAAPTENIADLMDEMDGLGSISFDKIKIPSGGGIAFEFPSDDPDQPESKTAIEGVICSHQPKNVYFRDAYDGDNNPPDCASNDGKTGIVTVSGAEKNCATCKYNQFGSGRDGVGKACQNRMDLYIMTEDRMMPVVLSLPSTSLKAFKEYLGKRVVLQGKRLCQVKTKITLKKDKSKSGIVYSTCVFTKLGNLDADEAETAAAMREVCRQVAASEAASAQSDDYVELTGSDEALPFNDDEKEQSDPGSAGDGKAVNVPLPY